MALAAAATVSSDAEKARARLLDVVERCTADRFSFFPAHAREPLDREVELVIMGGQKSSLDYHLDLVGSVVAANPGVRLRAVVDEQPQAVASAARVRSMGAELLSVEEFFGRAAEFGRCLAVDRYCTWIPGVKYKARLRAAGIPVLRLEQFLNAPGLAAPCHHYRAHSDFMLSKFDRFLALEGLWADDKSRQVYYTSLSAFISLDFTWFAFGCDDHEERYLPSDIGLALGAEEVFVDCGAHDGSESILFAKRVQNRFRAIAAFEPDRRNFPVVHRNLNRYMIEHRLDNMLCYPMGVYDRNDYLGFTGHDVTVTVTGDHASSGPGLFVARLDDVLEDMTYLKLEIEGAELAALRGADRLIRSSKPVLAVSTYHKPDDFLDLTAHVLSLDMGYGMKLRHQSLEAGVMCIYCQ